MAQTEISSLSFSDLESMLGASPLLILAVAALILAALILIRRIIGKRTYNFLPFGRISSPQAIKALLSQSIDQYRPFELQIGAHENSNRPTLKCIPVDIDDKAMVLEAVGLKKLSDSWLGRAITIFFRVASQSEFSYHTFRSVISGISYPMPEICHISFPLPDFIDKRQQRSFLRIRPPLSLLQGAAVWYGDTLPTMENMNELSNWPRPVLYFIPNIIQQIDIADLSAGGTRLVFPHSVVKELDLKLSTLDRIIIMMDLYCPDEEDCLRIWIQCRSQRISVELPSHDVHLGAKFLAWGRPKKIPGPNGDIEWLRIAATQEVAPISNWIMRRHLEMFHKDYSEIESDASVAVNTKTVLKIN